MRGGPGGSPSRPSLPQPLGSPVAVHGFTSIYSRKVGETDGELGGLKKEGKCEHADEEFFAGAWLGRQDRELSHAWPKGLGE